MPVAVVYRGPCQQPLVISCVYGKEELRRAAAKLLQNDIGTIFTLNTPTTQNDLLIVEEKIGAAKIDPSPLPVYMVDTVNVTTSLLLIVRKEGVNSVISCTPVSSRLLSIGIATRPDNITSIQTRRSNSEDREERHHHSPRRMQCQIGQGQKTSLSPLKPPTDPDLHAATTHIVENRDLACSTRESP
ncbi:hypothetical protein DPMN_174853 [Dreissena polymorpha]|uniref:Uncharacterized protein n=1 Tax=Dreissena polymorpha TaxID=45954 RepID=A0A9D4E889_DREPO|nr:hypothetical protein DPMN_174853 [Dreissena polymorpha]